MTDRQASDIMVSMNILVNTPTGFEAVLDGDCEDVTQILPAQRLQRLAERCKDPFCDNPEDAEVLEHAICVA